MDFLLNTLLADEVLGKDLSDQDKATVKSMVQDLTGEIQAETSAAPDLEATEQTELTAELDELLAELGVHSTDQSSEITMNDLLNDQSDANLIDLLSGQVESANEVVEILCYRPISKQVVDELRRVEMQLVGLSIGVADLREAVEQRFTPRQQLSITRKRRIKALLLKEFNFLNSWVRRL